MGGEWEGRGGEENIRRRLRGRGGEGLRRGGRRRWIYRSRRGR